MSSILGHILNSISPNDLVLDVGSGFDPVPRANVFVDKYLDNRSRGKDLTVPSSGHFLIGDGERLPFKDKQFDFAFCRHTLEHVENPELVCRELQRTAKAGYIVTPSYLWEIVEGRPYHLWFMFYLNETLFFVKKHRTSLWDSAYTPLPRKWWEIIRADKREYLYFLEKKYFDLTHIEFVWYDKFSYQVIRSNTP